MKIAPKVSGNNPYDNRSCGLAPFGTHIRTGRAGARNDPPLQERKNIDPISTKSTAGHTLIVRQEGIAFSAIPKHASF